MSDRSWTISGINSGETFFEQIVSVDTIAESEVKELLRRLAARHLSEADVVAASLGSDHRVETLDLEELSEGPYGFTTETSFPIYYTAVLSDVLDDDDEDEDDDDEDDSED